jgi:predicted enzyme related to lactoylglutathione lyase
MSQSNVMATPHSEPDLALYLTEIKVTDWPALVRWYVEVLGLRLALEDASRQYALLEAGPGRLALKSGAAAGLARDTVRLVFEVADVDAERDRLVGLGVAVSLPEERTEGYRAIRLHDPEGTPVTLFCWRSIAHGEQGG